MRNTNKGLAALCIPLFSILILFASCESPGSVGEEYIEKSGLIFDTLSVTNLENQNYVGYTGRLNHLAIGSFNDPVFGDISAFSILKPSLTLNLPSGDTLDANSSLKLELTFNKAFNYGDTLNAVNYSIYEVDSYWNGVNLKASDNVTYDETALVGSFSHTNEDSLIIELSDTWKQYYSDLAYSPDPNDSLLQYEFKGLAIVAEAGANRIVQPAISKTNFLVINSDSIPDTTNIAIRDWAFSYERAGGSYPSDVAPLHSTIENIIRFSLEEHMSAIEGRNFIKAELVFFEATDVLESALQPNEVRPKVNNLYINLGEEDEEAYEIQLGSAEFLGARKASDNTYRLNITPYFNSYLFGSEDRTNLYFGIGSATGGILSTLVYTDAAPEALQPKLILTFLEGEGN